MTKRLLIVAGAAAAMLAVSGCGRVAEFAYDASRRAPPQPVGSTEAMTPQKLIEPGPQARPQRSDEVLRKSEERRSDEFDLPPT